MGKGAKAPKPPDMTAAADKTAAAAKAGAYDVMNQNRYTQVGPEGSRNVWDAATNTNTTTMGAQPQAAYDAMMAATTGNMGQFQNKYWGGGGAPAGGGGGISINVPGGGGESPLGKGIQKNLDYS